MEERILVIKLHAYNSLSSSNMRMLAMMKGLDELGFKMDLLCTPVSSVTTINDMSGYDFLDRVTMVTTQENKMYESLTKNKPSGINTIKKKVLPILRTVYHKFSLYTNSEKIARKLDIGLLPHRNYKYVISVSDPKSSQIALMTLLNQGLKCEKVIEYWGDPMTGDITQKAIYPEFIIKREERKLLKLADKIVYTSPFTLEMEKKNHPMYSSRMIYVPTANAFPKIYPKSNNPKYTVGYYGAYNSWIRNIMPLYNAFSALRGEARLNLVGDSDLQLNPTENILIKPRGVVKDLEEVTDLFVCILNSSGTQIPGKLYHNAATNKPVLVIVDGDQQERMREYLESFDRFVVCGNKEAEIIAAIKDTMNDRRSWEPCKLLEPKIIAAKIID